VLDDITPLRQLQPFVASAKLFLFKPKTAARLNGNARSGGVLGAAIIRYSLGVALQATDTLELDVVNGAGAVVRRVTTVGGGQVASAGRGEGRGARGGGGGRGGDVGAQLGTTRGLNQFTWDFRGRQATSESLHGVPTGAYTVRMKLGETTVSQSLAIVPDPRSGSTPAAEREHAAMVVSLLAMSEDLNRAIAELRDIRAQARGLTDRARISPVGPRDAAIQSLIASVDSLETAVITGGAGGPPVALDILHVAPKLNTDIAGLISSVEGVSGPVTSGEREQLARLRARSSAFQAAAKRVLMIDLERVNALVTRSGLAPPITRKRVP
jgi:hypothetical protein